jgi:hypothetical protein
LVSGHGGRHHYFSSLRSTSKSNKYTSARRRLFNKEQHLHLFGCFHHCVGFNRLVAERKSDSRVVLKVDLEERVRYSSSDVRQALINPEQRRDIGNAIAISITARRQAVPVTKHRFHDGPEGIIMPALSQLLSCRPSIQQPHCSNCQTEMALSRIMPSRSKLDLRTFECAKCNRIEKVVVAVDPINSYTLGWLLSELRPPR